MLAAPFALGCAVSESLPEGRSGAGSGQSAVPGGTLPGGSGGAGAGGNVPTFLAFDLEPHLVCPLEAASVAWTLSASPTSLNVCAAKAGATESCVEMTPAASGKVDFQVGADTLPGSYSVWGRAAVAGQSADSAPVAVEVLDVANCGGGAGGAPTCASATCVQSSLAVRVDGAIEASSGYGAQFGSECADGDETRAAFRNLKVCPMPWRFRVSAALLVIA